VVITIKLGALSCAFRFNCRPRERIRKKLKKACFCVILCNYALKLGIFGLFLAFFKLFHEVLVNPFSNLLKSIFDGAIKKSTFNVQTLIKDI
jgi:hypothetical protein